MVQTKDLLRGIFRNGNLYHILRCGKYEYRMNSVDAKRVAFCHHFTVAEMNDPPCVLTEEYLNETNDSKIVMYLLVRSYTKRTVTCRQSLHDSLNLLA